MNTRLKLFLAAENISQAQFADKINVARGGISHILAGRNRPGYDFLKALMLHYPHLNIEWLMLGKGTMYKTETKAPASILPETEAVPAELPDLFTEHEKSEEISDTDAHVQENIVPLTALNTFNNIPQSAIKQRNVSKIIILFDDDTYQEM